MNCKPGDLAIVVSSVNKVNHGRIVRCVRLDEHDHVVYAGGVERFGVVWQVEPPLVAWNGRSTNATLDEYLRPIRDPGDDATDETLLWIGSPTKEAA